MKLNELVNTQPELPIEMSAEQIKRADDLATVIANTKFAVEPSPAVDGEPEFVEM